MKRSRPFRWKRLAGIFALLGAMPILQSAWAEDSQDAWTPLAPLHLVGQEDELLAVPGTVQAARLSDNAAMLLRTKAIRLAMGILLAPMPARNPVIERTPSV